MKEETQSTVEKAIRLLLILSKETEELGTTDLGRRLNMHKSTASRILLKLAEFEFVYKSKETGKYGLGPAIHHISMVMADRNFREIMEIAPRHIKELCDTVNETVSLEVWLGNSTVPAYSAHPTQLLRVVPPPGEPLPLNAAAGAKAILSFTHHQRVDKLLDGELPKLTSRTITDKELLLQQLVEFNRQGYAVEREEFHKGICAIASPIFGRLKQPVAAITVLVPTSRFSLDVVPLIAPKIKKKAKLISTKLVLKWS